MAPAVAKFIATRSIDEAATLVCLDDIPDLEYRDYAQKVLEASKSEELVELCENPTVLGLLDSAGFVGQQLSLENAHVAVQQIIMHEVLNKRSGEMADIASGMETLSLQKLLSACPDLVNVVFPLSKA
ncbi:Hypothetical predicted protein [Paramuricea clavata]|uniref:Uncharacterized protein n=1 Tax=Paramuricea clavata TaxID=317549 RepID=A0A6S7FXV5_PARCT|nr:Hypothetical predicted protein [Paramuricea clavata]